ncbi:hypothetical protein H4R35_000791 [Dimargaris xerosporica]|nr:hypothetical protein H4R35_000791 [Dimargaris xerosporica]
MTVAQETPAAQANNTVDVAALKENVAPSTTEAPTANGKASGGSHDDTDASATATTAPNAKRVKSNHGDDTDTPADDKAGEIPAITEDDKVAEVSETVELIQNNADYDEEEDDDFEVNAEDEDEEFDEDDDEAADDDDDGEGDDDDDDGDFGAEDEEADGVNEAELIEDEEGLDASEAEEEAAERDMDAKDQHRGEQDDE